MFSFDNLATIGGHSRRGNAFQIYSYSTNDILTEILTDGYFNEMRGKLGINDLIIIHREDSGGGNPLDFIVRITEAPLTTNIIVNLTLSLLWDTDGTRIFPVIDGRQVHCLTGGFYANDIDASKIVHTNSNKKLVSIDINSAYNKDFKTDTPLGDSDSGSAGSAEDIPRGDHQHPKVPATTTTRGQVELATNTETQTGTDATRAVTPASLSSRTATETRTGIAEIATQPETDAGSDDSKIVTPKKLNDRAATESLSGIVEFATDAETITGTDDTKATHPKGVKAAIDATLPGDNPSFTTVTVTGSPSGTPDANKIYKDNIINGWIVFNGTGTISIKNSFNITSITDLATGQYTITFDRDFADTNYAAAGSCLNYGRVSYFSKSVGSIGIAVTTYTEAFIDRNDISVIFFGDQ